MGRGARLALMMIGLSASSAAGAGLFDDIPSRIPIPASVWRGEAVDHGGTVVPLERVSFEGEVFLYGRVGAGQVTVPFANLKSIAFRTSDDEKHRVARVVTSSGELVDVTVDSDVRLYGRTRYGTYAIRVRDLERFTLFERVEP